MSVIGIQLAAPNPAFAAASPGGAVGLGTASHTPDWFSYSVDANDECRFVTTSNDGQQCVISLTGSLGTPLGVLANSAGTGVVYELGGAYRIDFSYALGGLDCPPNPLLLSLDAGVCGVLTGSGTTAGGEPIEVAGFTAAKDTSGGPALVSLAWGQHMDAQELLDQALQGLRRGVPSDDCTSPSATVIDGYFGSLYARLKTQGSGTGTWVCARLQPEGGTEYAGGKLDVGGSSSVVGEDSSYGACSTQTDNLLPGPHPFRSGQIGDPSSPPYVPYLIDAYANANRDAWLCLEASLGVRVTVKGGSSVFQQDDPTLATAPARTPWTVGKASTDCETEIGGTKSQFVNAVIDGSQVWLDEWQSGSKVELCVRAQGSSMAGGRFSWDLTGSPGIAPVVSQGTDATPCGTGVFSDDQDQLYVKRSATGTNPASVCVTKGATTERITVGYSGSPTAPLPTWTADS